MADFAYKIRNRDLPNTGKKLSVIKEYDRGVITIGSQKIRIEDLNPTIQRFNQFWELMSAIKQHGYLRAAISVVGKSAVGSWWYLAKHPEAKAEPPDLQRRKLMEFYSFKNKDWTNIKDYQNFAHKLVKELSGNYFYFVTLTFRPSDYSNCFLLKAESIEACLL